jgi:hypothetical protein
MLFPSFLFFIMKNLRVCLYEEFIFGIIQLTPTDPVWEKNTHVSIETANKYIYESARLSHIKKLVIPNSYV